MATRKAGPAPRDGAARRTFIRDKALELFSNNGFDGTSTRQIAAAAGLETGHLTYYYPSKEALWREVVLQSLQEFEATVDAALALASKQRSATARARIVLPRFLGYLLGNAPLARVVMQEFSVQSPRHDWIIDTLAKPLWARMKPLFEELESRAVLGGVDAATAYFSLVAGAVTLIASSGEIRRISGYDLQAAGRLEQAIAFLLRGILGPQDVAAALLDSKPPGGNEPAPLAARATRPASKKASPRT